MHNAVLPWVLFQNFVDQIPRQDLCLPGLSDCFCHFLWVWNAENFSDVVVQTLRGVWLFGTPWMVARQAPRPWNFPGNNSEWVAISFSRGSSWPRDLGLLHRQVDSLPLSHWESLIFQMLELNSKRPWDKGLCIPRVIARGLLACPVPITIHLVFCHTDLQCGRCPSLGESGGTSPTLGFSALPEAGGVVVPVLSEGLDLRTCEIQPTLSSHDLTRPGSSYSPSTGSSSPPGSWRGLSSDYTACSLTGLVGQEPGPCWFRWNVN